MTATETPSGPATGRPGIHGDARRTLSLITAAWVLVLGFDLFLHAGILAGLYVRDSPFLLPPQQAFARIPAGYLTFLLLTVGLFWFFRRIDVRGWRDGFRLGLGLGLFLWGTLALGLWSITTAEIDLLVGWTLGQGVELGLAGAVLGAGLDGASLARVWRRVGAAVVLLAVAAVVIQNVG